MSFGIIQCHSMSFATILKSTYEIMGSDLFSLWQVLKRTSHHYMSSIIDISVSFHMWYAVFFTKSLRVPAFLLQMSHAATSALCRSIKLQCELYPSRQIAICLDPYCGLGFALWCLCRYVVSVIGFLTCSQPSLESKGTVMHETVREMQINLCVGIS